METGNLFIVAAPSGAGKTTLVRMLLDRDTRVQLSVSHTTRPPREGEADGRDYHFVDTASFNVMRERGDFIEYARVHDNFYGTSRTWLEAQRQAGRDVLLEIDWQGARQVRHIFPDAIGIFILPPNTQALQTRLCNRALDTPDIVARRLAVAAQEMRHVDEFEFVIINEDIQAAADDLYAVVRAARLRLARQRVRHMQLFSMLTAG
jgi:guanylate kinase